MSEQAAKLLEGVLALPAEDRTAIRRALNARRRQELADEEHAEIMRRSDSVHNGTAVLIDGEQVIEDIRRRLAAKYGADAAR